MSTNTYGQYKIYLPVDRNNGIVNSQNNIKIVGDDRDAAGVSFIDGHTPFISSSGSGSGLISLSNSGNDLSISAASTNPDFGVMGFKTGDKVIVYDNSKSVNEMVISSVSPQTLTFTVTSPIVGSVGSCVMLIPNQQIDWNEQLTQYKNSVSGVEWVGFEFLDMDDVSTSGAISFMHCYFRTMSKVELVGPSVIFNDCTFISNGNSPLTLSNQFKELAFCAILGDNTATNAGIVPTLGSEFKFRASFLHNYPIGINMGIQCKLYGFTNTINGCDTGLRSIYQNSFALEQWDFQDCNTRCVDIYRLTIGSLESCSFSGTGIGIRATLQAAFQIHGTTTNTCSTPYEPATAYTPNATLGVGGGY